jgi:hypothetical protein
MDDVAINGQLYSWANIAVTLLGRDIAGILAIDYDDGMTVKKVMGRGTRRIGRVVGNYDAAGALTLEMSEVEALNLSVPAGQTIYDIAPFDITVTYTNPDQLLVCHVLQQCTFTKQNRGSKAGEVKEIEVKLALDIAQINWAA